MTSDARPLELYLGSLHPKGRDGQLLFRIRVSYISAILLLDAQLPTRDLQVVGFESIPECKFSSLVVELTHPGELDHSLRDPPMGPCAMVNALDVPACMFGIDDP